MNALVKTKTKKCFFFLLNSPYLTTLFSSVNFLPISCVIFIELKTKIHSLSILPVRLHLSVFCVIFIRHERKIHKQKKIYPVSISLVHFPLSTMMCLYPASFSLGKKRKKIYRLFLISSFSSFYFLLHFHWARKKEQKFSLSLYPVLSFCLYLHFDQSVSVLTLRFLASKTKIRFLSISSSFILSLSLIHSLCLFFTNLFSCLIFIGQKTRVHSVPVSSLSPLSIFPQFVFLRHFHWAITRFIWRHNGLKAPTENVNGHHPPPIYHCPSATAFQPPPSSHLHRYSSFSSVFSPHHHCFLWNFSFLLPRHHCFLVFFSTTHPSIATTSR